MVILTFSQVWRKVSGYTYRIIHQTTFDIPVSGYHEFKLNHGKRDIVEAGDVLGIFTCLTNEVQVIWYDILVCRAGPTLIAATSEVTTPLIFSEKIYCRHYSVKAVFVGNGIFVNTCVTCVELSILNRIHIS